MSAEDTYGDDDAPWDAEPVRDLGPCCRCGKRQDGTVRTLIMLPFEGPRGTTGWGCIVCRLEMIGATAIVCDACVEKYPDDLTEHLKFVVAGRFASEGQRVLLKNLDRRPHEHDLTKHTEDEL